MNKGIVYGLYTALALAAYFLLMKLFGLHDQYWLRVFNVFIVGTGLYLLLNNQFRKGNGHMGYFGGLGLGIRMTVTAVTVFVIFLAIYVNFLDKEFMENLDTARIWGSTMSMEQAVIGILIEGVVSGVIMTFIMMQFFKGYIHPRDDA